MNNFENSEHKYSRLDIIERIKDYSPIDPIVIKMLKDWVKSETDKEGLSGTPKGIVYSLIKEASLYFDAGFEKESINTLKKAEIYSKIKDKPPHVKEEAKITVDEYGSIKKDEELYDYFLTTSRELERVLKNTIDHKE